VELVLPRLLFFDRYGEGKREERGDIDLKRAPKEERRLFCATCHNLITNQDDRISIQGAQEHTFTNPHGYVFHIGCFGDTRGCSYVGERMSAWSWFRGYTWRIALCGECNTHLGWLFEAAETRFYGLILNRLTSSAPS
jgi:hypothetical protein